MKKSNFGHFAHNLCINYANLCIIIHATDTILFRCLPLVMTKANVKFHPDPTSSFGEKLEQTDMQTDAQTDTQRDVEKYYILAVCTRRNG